MAEHRESEWNGSSAPAADDQPASKDATIIFHHIPKTAGSTLESILERRYAFREIFDVDRSRDVHERLLGSVPDETRAGIRLIKGHMDFGVHRFIANPYAYITILRHPVERVISHYYYVMRTAGHRLHYDVAFTGMSLEQYITSGITLELNNGQVRSLVGPEHLGVEYGRCTREMLGTAQRNLTRHFSVVGLTERFDETLLLLRRRLGWSAWPFYRPKNVSKARPLAASIPREVIRLIEAHNELDLELYEAAQAAFTETIAGLELSEELARFRRWNRVLGPCSATFDAFRTIRRRLVSDDEGALSLVRPGYAAQSVGSSGDSSQRRHSDPRALALRPSSSVEATNGKT